MSRAARVRWPDRRLLLALLLGSCLVHALFVAVVRVHDVADQVHGQDRPSVRALLRPQRERALTVRLAALLDPSLLSLPSAQGFSAAIWSAAGWVRREPIVWPLTVAALAVVPPAPATLVAEPSLIDTLQVTGAKSIGDDEPGPAVTRPAAVVAAGSVLRVLNGGAEPRPIVRGPALPVIVQPSPLRPSVVRVGVGLEGMVRFAALESGSGNGATDGEAVRLARQVRFAPAVNAGSESLEWLLLQFVWKTEPPAPAPAR
jgi:hypothetical protein